MPPPTSSTPEILTFGEAMAMFVAEASGELAEVERFQRRIAGADTNVAIGLARLGFRVGWLSRVGADSFGAFIQQTLETEGVDCRHLRVDPEHSTGLLFKERDTSGTDPRVEYFRRGSAASHLTIEDADGIDFAALRHLHATGIPPALSDSCHALSETLLKRAREAGASISFDPNLRPGLWPSETVMRKTLNKLAVRADWVLPGLAEGRFLTGHDTPEAIADFYLEQGAQAVFIKLGPEGSYYRGNLGGAKSELHCAWRTGNRGGRYRGSRGWLCGGGGQRPPRRLLAGAGGTPWQSTRLTGRAGNRRYGRPAKPSAPHRTGS